jgi:hypothetical protein
MVEEPSLTHVCKKIVIFRVEVHYEKADKRCLVAMSVVQ